jgi:hypothetical protein
MEQTKIQGNVMIGVRDVKRPVSGQTTGQRLIAVAYNMDATDMTTGERMPSIAKRYVLREVYGTFTEEKIQRFIKRYYADARIFRI